LGEKEVQEAGEKSPKKSDGKRYRGDDERDAEEGMCWALLVKLGCRVLRKVKG